MERKKITTSIKGSKKCLSGWWSNCHECPAAFISLFCRWGSDTLAISIEAERPALHGQMTRLGERGAHGKTWLIWLFKGSSLSLFEHGQAPLTRRCLSLQHVCKSKIPCKELHLHLSISFQSHPLYTTCGLINYPHVALWSSHRVFWN